MSKKVDGDYWRHECNRCGHIWYTMNERPGFCRGCNSPLWDKKRVRDPSIWNPKLKKNAGGTA